MIGFYYSGIRHSPIPASYKKSLKKVMKKGFELGMDF